MVTVNDNNQMGAGAEALVILNQINKVVLMLDAARCQLAAIELPHGVNESVSAYLPRTDESIRAVRNDVQEFWLNLCGELSGISSLETMEDKGHAMRLQRDARANLHVMQDLLADLRSEEMAMQTPEHLTEEKRVLSGGISVVAQALAAVEKGLNVKPESGDVDEGEDEA